MSSIKSDLRRILAETIVKKHRSDYSIVFIKPSDGEKARTLLRDIQPWSSITYAGEEISVVIPSSHWEKFKIHFTGHKEEGPYKLITFDIVLDLSIVGFLSFVSTALADAGISIYAVSTYMKDHILVKKADATRAVIVLDCLIAEARRG